MRESVAVKRSIEPARKSSADDIVRGFVKSVDNGKRSDKPYRYWSIKDCLPPDTVDDVIALPFEAPSLDGISGKRELHASLLELLAKCLRAGETEENADDLLEDLKPFRIPRATFN